MEFKLFLAAIILIACIFSHKIASRFGIPALLLFLGLGMLAGTDGLALITSTDYEIAEKICSIALAFIMFYGGFGTNWKHAKPVASRAFLLSTVGVLMTSFLVAAFCHFAIKTTWLEGWLIGAVISATDAASVFSILRSRNLNLKYNTASLLELESGSNDPTSYTLTFIVLAIMGATSTSGTQFALYAIQVLSMQIIIGTIVGVAAAAIAQWAFKKIDFEGSGLAIIFIIAVTLLSYSLPLIFGGNGYLSVYIAGIMLGNSKIKHKIGLVNFLDGISWLAQIILFFVLGLFSFPKQFVSIFFPAFFITIFLTFIARPITTFFIMRFYKTTWQQQILMAWSGLRGSSSIVFAMMAMVSPAYPKFDIFHIVFVMSLLSVSFQGTLLPVLARKLDMIDDSDSVSKTFNDYIDPNSMRLIEVDISAKNQWANKAVKDIQFQRNSLLVLIKRDGKFIVPHGSTVILPKDILVMNANTHYKSADVPIREEHVNKHTNWIGKEIKDINLHNDNLILMIKRDDSTFVPATNTIIEPDDIFVMTNV